MAKKRGVGIKTTIYNSFRGADFSTDPSLVEKYRSPLCTNIVADAGGMPEKRCGWRVLHSLSGRVNGLFCGEFEGVEQRLVHVGTELYRWDEATEPELLFTGLADRKSRGVYLNGSLWLVTGQEFLRYNGSSVQRVSDGGAYVPTVTITRLPEGGGVVFEDVNLLTPWRKDSFQTDGTAVTFLLSGSVDAQGDVQVWVWGEETRDFTVDREAGTVTLNSAPAAPDVGSADGLVVAYPHTVEGYAGRINACSIITTYGINGSDRLVLSGNPDYPNQDWISAYDRPDYVPDLSYAVVGTEDAAIRGYCRVGSYQAIVKEDNGQDSTVFLRSGSLNSEGEGVFTLQQALSGVGTAAPGSFAALLDDPLFLSATGVQAISVSDISGSRITQNRSYFLNARLRQEANLEEAEAVVWMGMYLLGVNSHVYVLDARQPKSYRSAALGDYIYEGYYWENVPARVWLCRQDGAAEHLYFGTEDGRICRFNSDMDSVNRFSDNGEPVSAVWATRYDDDGTPACLKTLLKRGCCVTIKPYARSSGTVYFRTDKTEGTEKAVAADTMDIFRWEDIDFERFTFASDDGPQEIFFNHKVKNYKRLQIIVRNAQPNEGFGVYQITKHYVVGNFAKGGAAAGIADSGLAADAEVALSLQTAFEAVFGAGTWRG